jgi:hypothetical protein
VTKALVYAANEYATLLRLSGYFRRTNVTFLINSAGTAILHNILLVKINSINDFSPPGQALPPNSTTIQWTLREFQPSGVRLLVFFSRSSRSLIFNYLYLIIF